eukprot:g29360.t1
MGVKSNLLAAILCCNTSLSKEKGEDDIMKWTPKGNSSEAPIVVAARKVGLSENIASEYPRVLEVPFSSSRKMMLTVSKVGGSLLCQGGMPLPVNTNYLTDLCCEQLKADGTVAKLTDEDKAGILKIVDGYSARALRVLAIAARPMSKLPYDENNEDLSTDQKFDACRKQLRLMGLVASIDPERDGVPDSVVAARGAGIRVVMITGDYLLTAIAIAKNVNILQASDDIETSAMDCASLRPDGEYLSPQDQDKLEIVKSIQRQGQVAAMTGDGVNDAPALNQADIGVAMGIQGTEVAKGAAETWKGRAIYSGIQKFVAFIMSVHIAEVMQIFICIVTGIPVMRTPLQILFLILVTDLPPSIALGMEPGEANILKMRPRPKEEPIVLMWMWMAMIMNGAVLTIVVVGVYLISLINYCDGEVFQSNMDLDDKSVKVARHETMHPRRRALLSIKQKATTSYAAPTNTMLAIANTICLRLIALVFAGSFERFVASIELSICKSLPRSPRLKEQKRKNSTSLSEREDKKGSRLICKGLERSEEEVQPTQKRSLAHLS